MMQVVKTCLRYVLPFHYSSSFDDTVNLVMQQEVKGKQMWIPETPRGDMPESDIFSYIREENYFEPDLKVSEYKSGVSWIHRESAEAKGSRKILSMFYFEDPVKAEDEVLPGFIGVTMSSMGLVLYKNKLGFLWYELQIPDDRLSPEGLLLFQNRVKELDRSEERCYFWEACRHEPEAGVVYDEKGGHKKYMAPILLGRWLKGQLSFMPVHFFAGHKSAYDSMMKKAMKSAEGLPFEKKAYVPTPKTEEQLPDKALLFSYALFKEEGRLPERDAGAAYTYRLANGYKSSYIIGEDITAQIRQPFGNAFWFASQEGAAYTAWAVPENEKFFSDGLRSKIRVDYFTLYLKALYQSFSLLIYAERIQKNIPAELKDPAKASFKQPVTDLLGEISLFLTRSMATSVSHIHHQSTFYIYLKQQLRIKEDIESVTAGMNALEVVLREQADEAEKQRDYQMQAAIALFGLLAFFSALADCKGFFDNFESLHSLYVVLMVVIVVVTAITFIYLRNVILMVKDDFINLIKRIFTSGGKK